MSSDGPAHGDAGAPARSAGDRVLLDGTHRAPLLEPGETVRVLVVDDHALYRRGLRLVLDQEPDIDVVGECADGTSAVSAAVELAPDVVLMDVRMPGTGGIEACARVTDAAPRTRIVMLTTSDDERDLVDSVRAGAVGYLLKDIPPEEVVDGVRAVRNGRSLLSPSLASGLLTEYAAQLRCARPVAAPPAVAASSSSSPPAVAASSSPPGRSPDPVPRLTARELEVLQLVARGMRNKDIGRHLFISENTVKNHVRNILEKLHVHSRTEAATYGVRSRLVAGPGV